MKHRTALIVNRNMPLSIFPSVYNTADILIMHGYNVDLFLSKEITVDHNIRNVNILRFHTTKPAIIGILWALVFKVRKYDMLICYGIPELIASGIMGEIYKIPYLFFCLEILGSDQTRTLKSKVIKYLAIFFNKRAIFTIVQDENRKDLIRKMHRLKQHLIFCVPNSFIGIIEEKSRFLRDKLNISDDKIIILYSGAIESWAINAHLIKSVSQWNDPYVFVLHGWSRNGYLQTLRPLIDKINEIKKKIYLSLDLVNAMDYEKLVASADIGLAWYKKDLPINVATIGLSSGKLAAYLRCGLPVIVPEYLSDFKNLVNKHQIGVVVNNEYEIGIGITLLIKHCNIYRNNAFKVYSQYLDFAIGWKSILERIDNIFK